LTQNEISEHLDFNIQDRKPAQQANNIAPALNKKPSLIGIVSLITY
jgi:hypothetical protein